MVMRATSEPPLGSVIASAAISSPARHGGEYPGLHVVVAEALDWRQADVVGQHRGDHATGAGAGELLHDHHAHDGVSLAVSAVLGVETIAEQSDRCGPAVQVDIDLAGLLPRRNVGHDLALGELGNDLAKCEVMVVVERIRSSAHRASVARLRGGTDDRNVTTEKFGVRPLTR